MQEDIVHNNSFFPIEIRDEFWYSNSKGSTARRQALSRYGMHPSIGECFFYVIRYIYHTYGDDHMNTVQKYLIGTSPKSATPLSQKAQSLIFITSLYHVMEFHM